jgi:hypothetical protein
LRTTYLAVTATVDAASLQVVLSSVAFYIPPVVVTPTTGATFLSITFAAVVGLISLAFF